MILAHYVRSQSTSRSALPSHGVYEHALCCFNSLLDEIENSIARFIFTIQDHLVVLVKPEKGEVSHSDRLPVIRNLLSGTVDNMRDLIGNNKLYIL